MLNSKKAKVWSVLLAVVACIIVGICLVNHFKDTKKDSAKSNENTKLEDKSGEEFNLDKSSIESENEGENVVLLDGMYEGTPYDEFNVPRLVIQTSDQTFQFSYDAFMSYLPMGSYEIKDGKVICKADGASYTYVFRIVDQSTLFFIEEESSKIELVGGRNHPFDGMEFHYKKDWITEDTIPEAISPGIIETVETNLKDKNANEIATSDRNKIRRIFWSICL